MSFQPALSPIIQVLGNSLSRGDESDAVSIMEYLVQIAQMQPLFFKGAVDNVVSAMLSVASSDALEFPTRSIALELMVTLGETAPALARRCQALITGLVPLAMSLMLELDDTDETSWRRGSYTEEVEDENSAVGEEAIERAAAGMGGRVVAPPVLALVQEYGVKGEWIYRRAGDDFHLCSRLLLSFYFW
jgi:hypothetical protein